MRNSLTSKELYEILINTPNLHSLPKLEDGMIKWDLYYNAYIYAYVDGYDTCIDLISNSTLIGSYVHWHPDEEDIYNELCLLGTKENFLVLHKSLFGTSVFYLGETNKYKYSLNKKWHWGKLIYFKQK